MATKGNNGRLGWDSSFDTINDWHCLRDSPMSANMPLQKLCLSYIHVMEGPKNCPSHNLGHVQDGIAMIYMGNFQTRSRYVQCLGDYTGCSWMGRRQKWGREVFFLINDAILHSPTPASYRSGILPRQDECGANNGRSKVVTF